MTSKNKKLTILFIGGLFVVCLIVAGVWLITRGVTFQKSNKICEGVTIDGIDVGGLTKKEAESRLNEHIQKLLQREVTITIDENEVAASAEVLGFSCEEKDVLERAYRIGKEGNFLTNYQKLPEQDKKKGEFKLEYQVDEDQLGSFVEDNCTSFDVKPKNSKLKLKNGVFTATKSRNGRQIKVDETVAVLSHALTKDVKEEPLTVAAVVDVFEPKYTQKQVEKCKDLLGSYSTSYATSNAARANNVHTAAKYIDGTIVYPGKTFSTIKVIKERTEANGYQAAPEYSSGNVVEGIGGGVCQVSTTLYNAVINAELEVVERSPHSMVVSYVDVSRDAAISGTYKDFKFKNNTDVPVYIAATADGATLSFRIYGEETREKNRTIKFESKILDKIEPGDPVTTVDQTKPVGYRDVTQSAHVGYRAQLWKIIYIDGKKTDQVMLNSSSYSAEPQHIVVGPTRSQPTPAPKETQAPREATPAPKATKAPSVTKAPKATQAPKETKAPEEETPTKEPE